MNRGLVNLEELRKNFDKADFTNGKCSYCFIQDNKIIKIYANKYGVNCIEPSRVCDFSKFKADTIIFPFKYIKENGVIVGEISNYIKNKDIIHSFNGKADLNKMIKGFELVIQDMYTYANIDMKDLCSVNILYSNELGFHIIDTTEWQIVDNALKLNIHRFNSSLIGEVVDYSDIPVVYSKYYNRIDNRFYENMAKFGKSGLKLQENMKLLMNNQFNFLNLLYAYMEIYRIYASREAETLEDIKELTKVLKKG